MSNLKRVSYLAALAILLTAPCFLPAAGKSSDPAKRANFRGQIVTMSAEDKTITLEDRTSGQPVRTVIKLTDKTKVELMGPGFLGTEKVELKVGYYALVWLVEGSKDTARGIRANLHQPSFTGKILSVSEDGKTISLESKTATPVTLKITDQTAIEFIGIDKAEDRKLKADYFAIVWLQKKSKDSVGKMKVGIKK